MEDDTRGFAILRNAFPELLKEAGAANILRAFGARLGTHVAQNAAGETLVRVEDRGALANSPGTLIDAI